MKEPTKKQLDYIDDIYECTDAPKFTGSTRREAAEYISKYKPMLDNETKLRGVVMESMHGDYGCRDE